GHGFSRVDNQIDAYKRVADFLKAHVPPADCSCEIKPLERQAVAPASCRQSEAGVRSRETIALVTRRDCRKKLFLYNGRVLVTMALISPGMVYWLASTSTPRWSSRRVADVTGPIDAMVMPSRWLRRFLPRKLCWPDPSKLT